MASRDTTKADDRFIRVPRPSFGIFAAGLALALGGASMARADSSLGYAEYYVLGDEAQIIESLKDIPNSPVPGSHTAAQVNSRLSIVASANDVQIYLDEWEDGYSFDPADPSNTADARWDAAPGGSPALVRGQVVTLTETDTFVTGSQGVDGGDRIYISGAPVTVIRTVWSDGPGTYVSGSWPLYPTTFWQDSYTLPVGKDIVDSELPFELTDVHIQARYDNTRVVVTDPIDGERLDTVIDSGENIFVQSLNSGATVVATEDGTSDPADVQVGIITSSDDYTTRYYTLSPDELLGAEYYLPAPTMTHPPSEESGRAVITAAYIFAKEDGTTVEIETATGTSTVNLDSGDVHRYVMPQAPYNSQQGPYAAVARSTDANKKIGILVAGDDQQINVDWGYQAIPTEYLVDNYYIPYAPVNPLHITPVYDRTEFFVDFESDGVADDSFVLDRFDTRRVYDPDTDLAGANVYATGPFVVAWGQDDTEYTPGEPDPDIDQGYTVLPLTWFTPVIGIDYTVDSPSLPNSGGTVEFTVVVESIDSPVFNVDINATLPNGFQYLNGTASIVYSDGTPASADNPSINGLNLLWELDHDLAPNETITITFQAQTASGFQEGINISTAEAYGTNIVDESNPAAFILRPADSATILIASNAETTLTASKSSNAASVTTPNGPIDFTITVDNTGSLTANDLAISDLLPPGLTYVPDSASITTDILLDFYALDDFSPSNSYSGNDGTKTWATDWVESENNGPNSGDIRIVSDLGDDRLRLEDDNQWIGRQVDLSGANEAELSFIYRRESQENSSHQVDIQVRRDSTDTWTTLGSILGPGDDSSYSSASYTITSADISDETQILFFSDLGNNDYLLIDDVRITVNESGSTTFAGTPTPDLVRGISLPPGGTLTATFQATVDQPLPAGITSIDNSADVYGSNVAPVESTSSDALASIGNLVFSDVDGDGSYEPGDGEGPLAGIVVDLIGAGPDGTFGTSDDIDYGTQTSAADGSYSFTGLMPGDYAVSLDATSLPSGSNVTTGNDPVVTTLTFGETENGIDYGIQQPPSTGGVAGRLFLDIDGDGTQDAGEPGIAGVDVVITPDTGSPLTVTTNDDGDYAATDLAVGTATVDIDETDLPAGAVLTTGLNFQTLTVTAGSTVNAQTNGYQQQGTISGHLFIDLDGDGTQDAGEPGLEGIDVVITPANGSPVTVTTDANGDYTASDLPAGSATADVDETDLPAGAVLTTGADTQTLTINGGATTTAADNGYQQQGSISGHLFIDLDGDGTQDAGEPDLSGIDVVITPANGSPVTVTTDANGDYTASDLPAGSATADVDETDLPAGAVLTTGADTQNLTITGGAITTASDNGYQQQGSVSGHLFLDEDEDGIQDAGEPDLADVDIIVTDVLGAQTVVTTDANGDYIATGIPVGDTVVDVDDTTLPTGSVLTTGGDPQTITIEGGTTKSAIENGYRRVGNLGGHVFLDENGNGVQDAGEPDLADVTIFVTNDDKTTTRQLMTDALGDFTTTLPLGSFNIDLIPGDPYLPFSPIVTTANVPQTVTVTGSGTDTASAIGIQSGASCALDWSHLIDTDDFFGGYPSDGPSSPTQHGRTTLPSAAFPVGAGHVTVSINGRYMLDGNDDGLIDFPQLNDVNNTTRTFGFGKTPPPFMFVQKSFLNGRDGDTELTFEFDHYEGAENVNFTIYDIDRNSNTLRFVAWIDRVAVVGTDINGNTVYPSLTPVGITNQLGFDGNAGFGLGSASDGGTDLTASSNMYVDFGSTALRSFTVDYQVLMPPPEGVRSNYPAGNQGIGISSIAFNGCDVGAGGTFEGTVFEDVNGNGTLDTGEPGLPDIDVDVIMANGEIVSATTDASGEYSYFVYPGSTTAVVDGSDADLPAGSVLTTSNESQTVDVPSSMTVTAVPVGYQQLGTLTGHLFLDENGNGVQDAGEPGLEGIDVVITPANGSPVTVTTDANGDYTASDLPAGSATVDVDETDLPAGAVLTTGADTQTLTITGGATTPAADNGYQQLGTLTGHLFLDENGNGVQDAGEPGLEGIDVVIADDYGTTQTVTTDADGNYAATVAAGDVTADVDETDLPAGAVLTTGADVQTITVGGGATEAAADNGYQQQGSVTGRVFRDVNGNGAYDSGEPFLGDISVTVDSVNGDPLTVTTDGNGVFTATGVPAGDASVDVDGSDSDLGAGSVLTTANDPQTVSVSGGASASATDFGYQQLGTLTGHLFLDENGNGVQDAGEPGLEGIDVVITPANGSPVTVTTDANGDYTASDLPAGSATADVDETDLPAGAVLTTGADVQTITVGGGATEAAADNGYQQLGTLTGHLFLDENGNGVQDAGEPDLEGVDVVIADDYGTTQTVTTDADGNYAATVAAGDVTADVDETDLPAGAVLTTGADVQTITVGGGATEAAADNGYQQQGSVTGRVFRDVNGNGVQDAGEPFLGDISVTVDSVNGDPLTVTTDVNGVFTATGVPAGDASVDVDGSDSDLGAGSVLTTANDPQTVSVSGGASASATDFGYQQLGTLTGHLFLDENGNGVQDAGEPGLEGIDVVITPANGSPVTVTTDANGDYTASDLPAGSATVDVDETDLPAGALLTTGADTQTLTINGGATTPAADNGYQQRNASISGTVWSDNDGNQTIGAGEIGLAGVTVSIVWAGPDGVLGTGDEGLADTVDTGADGSFSFENLPAGLFAVAADGTTLPAYYIATTPTNPRTPSLTVGEDQTGVDFGFAPADIEKTDGVLFDDVNDNGILDSGDTVVFEIILTNPSLIEDDIVDVTDSLPDGLCDLQFLSSADADLTSSTATTISARGVDVPAGSSVTIIYTARVCTSVSDGAVLTTDACGDYNSDASADLCDPGSVGPIANTHVPATFPDTCSETYPVTTYAGTGNRGYDGDNVLATSAKLFFPAQLAVDAMNNLYIADYSNHIIRRVEYGTGIITTVAGIPNTRGYSGDGGAATSARLNLPVDVYVRENTLYIADKGNHAIRAVDLLTGTIETVAGNGTSGYSGDGGPATAAQLYKPLSVAVDVAGNIYVADSYNFVIREVDAATGDIETIVGTGVHGHGHDGELGVNEPVEWVVDLAIKNGCDEDGVLYWSERNGYNIIRRLVDGRLDTVAGQQGRNDWGDCGPAELSYLSKPVGIAFDSKNNLYIADTENHKIRKLDADTNIMSTIVGTGVAGYNGDGMLGLDTQLNLPFGVVVGKDNTLYISDQDNHRVRAVDLNSSSPPDRPEFVDVPSGAIDTIAGTGEAAYNGDGKYARNASVSYPHRFAQDSQGNIYFTDRSNHRIRVIYTDWTIATIAGTGERGYEGDGGDARFAQLSLPTDLAVATDGTIYFTDSANHVVRRIDGATGVISTIAGDGTEGYEGDGGPALAAQLDTPDGIALFGSLLYVSDRDNNRIRVIDLANGIIDTIAGDGGHPSDKDAALGVKIGSPRGIDVDASGNLYIAAFSNHQIMRVDPSGELTIVAGTGIYGDSGYGTLATKAYLNHPTDVSVAPDGSFVFVDQDNHRVRRVTSLGVMEPFAGTGTAGFSGDRETAVQSQLNTPEGVFIAADGTVFIADTDNQRIRAVGAAAGLPE